MKKPWTVLPAVLAVAAILWAGIPVAKVVAAEPDPSDVVLVLDFSASILDDQPTRTQFADALDEIAARVDATSADLVAGDATVSIVRFAARAADYPGCVDLKLVDSPQNVARFADCLSLMATAYRAGLSPALTRSIGVDTNYVAAMQQASTHLPADSVRPAMILFTDGKHDVAGVPIGQVAVELDRLFGDRSPFALLPVGMGLDSADRPALEAGLVDLRIIREIPACATGAQFAWPQVVFESPAEAGNAVAVALQNVTCTFTVAPSPTPPPAPSPTPEPTPGTVQGLSLTPGDGRIALDWLAPAAQPAPIEDYLVRCRSGEGDWVESDGPPSIETAAEIEGLSNGSEYTCEVAAVDATGPGDWAAGPAATPIGPPGAPGKPVVAALDKALEVQVPLVDGQSEAEYRYECSADQGASWPIQTDVASSGLAPTTIRELQNGVDYVCRAYAANDSGSSGPSEVSDVVRPCGSPIECNPLVVGGLGIVGLVGVGGVVVALFALYRSRARGYVVAVVDVVHTANLGYGSKVGLRFVRDGGGMVTGIEPDRGRRAELRVRVLDDDRFVVVDRTGRHSAVSGEPILIVDGMGVGHSVTLRGFKAGTASAPSRG